MDPQVPYVTILLLGDAGVGKSTFLSRLTLGANDFARESTESLPPYQLHKLRDLDQPFIFDISMFNRPYQFAFYDTASPTHYTLLRPDFLILCYDISRRSTLRSVQTTWKTLVETHYNYDESLPIMLLGLKRDLRREWTEEEKRAGKGESIMPQEGLNTAQEMRCDRYAECSAVTGELCRQVLEDVARMAARTTTERGAKSDPASCEVM